jgi:hypothetical protein
MMTQNKVEELVINADDLAAAQAQADNALNSPVVESPAMTDEEMAQAIKLARPLFHSIQKPLYKQMLSGVLNVAKPRPQTFWYNGELISKEEWMALSEDARLASNNVIKRTRK